MAAFAISWTQCTRSAENWLDAPWQDAQVEFCTPATVAPSFRVVMWLANQALFAPDWWQLRQASLLGTLFQLSPCGVFGFVPVWHLAQLRIGCGKPTSE